MPETTGTITVTNGSTAVTGSGTLFADNFVGANDALVVDGDIYIIKSVSSNTALTLLTPYTGTSGSGKSYVIIHLTGEDVINLLARKTTTLVENYGDIAAAVTETPSAGGIPQADDNGKLADGWLSAKVPLLNEDGFFPSSLIVGSVAEGAIIERGSNANGEYTRFADGTQWCWGVIEVAFTDSPYKFTTIYPAKFLNDKVAGYACHFSSPGAFMVLRNLQPSTTGSGATWYLFPANNGTPNSTPVNYHWFVIGRWK